MMYDDSYDIWDLRRFIQRAALTILGVVALLIAAVIYASAAHAQSSVTINCANSSPPPSAKPCGTTANPVVVTSSGTVGTQDVNLSQVNGATVNVGAGAASTGTQRVTTSTDSTIGTVTAVTAITNALPAGSNIIGNVRIDQTTPGTTNGVVVNSGVLSNSVGITPTDRTVTSATGSSQTVMSSNASRHSLIIQNTGNANCGINPTGGTAVIGGAGTLTLQPTGSYQPRIPTLAAVTAICTSGQPLYAEEN